MVTRDFNIMLPDRLKVRFAGLGGEDARAAIAEADTEVRGEGEVC